MWDEAYRPRIRHDVQYRELEDGAVIYDTLTERIHTLNSTAAYIWNCCDGSQDLQQIASNLNQHLGMPSEELLEHVRRAVTQLHDEGLLRSQ